MNYPMGHEKLVTYQKALRGRFSTQSHRNFLEIALASVLKSAAT
jgi:hypothetical protein